MIASLSLEEITTTEEEYKELVSSGKPLLTEVAGQPRLTLEGIKIAEYGMEISDRHPELSEEQGMKEMFRHFPAEIRDDKKLVDAVEYYYASMVFGDEELEDLD